MSTEALEVNFGEKALLFYQSQQDPDGFISAVEDPVDALNFARGRTEELRREGGFDFPNRAAANEILRIIRETLGPYTEDYVYEEYTHKQEMWGRVLRAGKIEAECSWVSLSRVVAVEYLGAEASGSERADITTAMQIWPDIAEAELLLSRANAKLLGRE